MITIAQIRSSINAALDSKAELYGEDTDLTEAPLNDVSASIDDVNETVNPNLPKRPTD